MGSGARLEPAVRHRVERAWGVSLGQVSVHTGPRAQAVTSARKAAAATYGQQIAFAPGMYRPGTLQGDALIAHELAHVAQQAQGAAAPLGGHAEEREADLAAVTALRSSPAHRAQAQGQGLDVAAFDALPVTRPRLPAGRGLQLSFCDSMPDYGISEGAPASTTLAETHQGAREERLGQIGFLDRGVLHGPKGIIDGDGDQSAELELEVNALDLTPLGQPQSARVSARHLGNTPQAQAQTAAQAAPQTATFDLTGTRGDWRTPQVTQHTDGLEPTVIRLFDHSPAGRDFEIFPPAQDGPTADYRMRLNRPVGYGPGDVQTETHTLSFSRDPGDLFPVFVPEVPRRAGAIWVLDTRVGRYGDAFRFTFRPLLAGQVRVGISPMSGGEPVGVDQLDIPFTSPLDIQLVRSRGPVLELDLDGDGRTDLRLYQRLEPRADYRSSYLDLQPDRFRMLVTTLTNGDGSVVYGSASRQVEEGEFTSTSTHMETEFDSLAVSATAEGLEASAAIADLSADLVTVTRQLDALRATAVERSLMSSESSDAWDALVQSYLTLASVPQDGDLTQAANDAAAAADRFDTVWTGETAAGTTTENSFFVINAFTESTGSSQTTRNPYTGRERAVRYQNGRRTDSEVQTVASRLAAVLREGDRTRAGPLMSDLSRRVYRWVERGLRNSGQTAEADRAAGMVALLAELEQLGPKNPTRIPGVFHSAPDYISRGVTPSLPLRLYVWREGDTWHLKDLTHPTRSSSLGVIRRSGGTQTEPPPDLFDALNERQRYPKGLIHYELPSGAARIVRTTADWELHDVLGWIGLGFAAAALVAGLALSGGTAAPVLVPALWGLSAGFGAASAVTHMIHEHGQGRLDGGTIAMDVAQIIGSVAGATVLASRAVHAFRLGQAARLTAAAGTTLAPSVAAGLSPLGVGALRVLLVTQIAADTCQVILMGEQLARTLADIERSGMSDAEKLRARIFAIGQFGVATGLAWVSIRATRAELRSALDAHGQIIQAGEHVLVPGLHSEAAYTAELERLVSAPILEGMAAQRVRIIEPGEAGSSLGVARIDFVDGKPQLVMVNGAPLRAVQEEALHLQQFALLSGPSRGLSGADRRLRSAAAQVRRAAGSWASMSPAERLGAHQARLHLEEDAQLRMIRLLEADIAAGRPVIPSDVESAWMHLENLRTLQADLVGAEQALRSGRALDAIDPQLAEAPSLFSKKVVPSTPIDPSWRNLEPEDFVRSYRQRYPNTALTDDDLLRRHAMHRRLNPATGRLIDINRAVPDVTATYRGAPETLPMTGANATPLEAADDARIRQLLAERDAARAARDSAAAGQPPDVTARNAAQYQMNVASRELGETSAAIWVRRRYAGPPAAELIYPKGGGSRSGDFDQVWRCTEVVDGQQRTVWLVVEAKGGSSPLGSRRTAGGIRAGQGTLHYFDDIIRVMFAAGGEARTASRSLRTAQVAGSGQLVRYLHVEAPLTYTTTGTTVTSTLGNVSIREFDITPQGGTPHTTSSAVP